MANKKNPRKLAITVQPDKTKSWIFIKADTGILPNAQLGKLNQLGARLGAAGLFILYSKENLLLIKEILSDLIDSTINVHLDYRDTWGIPVRPITSSSTKNGRRTDPVNRRASQARPTGPIPVSVADSSQSHITPTRCSVVFLDGDVEQFFADDMAEINIKKVLHYVFYFRGSQVRQYPVSQVRSHSIPKRASPYTVTAPLETMKMQATSERRHDSLSIQDSEDDSRPAAYLTVTEEQSPEVESDLTEPSIVETAPKQHEDVQISENTHPASKPESTLQAIKRILFG